MSFLRAGSRASEPEGDRRSLRREPFGDERLPGRKGRPPWRRVLFWSVAVTGSGALLVVLVRMLMSALLVAPVVSGAVTAVHPSARSGAPPRATSSPVPCGAAVCPLGVAGSWATSFDDEFDGRSLDTSKWSTMDGQRVNGITALASNISVSDGFLHLTLSDPHHGAEVSSAPFDGVRPGGYLFPVGSYAEARVMFPGNGTSIYNWPAWWTSSGPAWPAGGEFDIAEAMDTLWTVYHGANGARYGASIPGVWSNEFHVYGVYRAVDHADIYWDGKKIASYPTADNGAGQGLLLTLGNGPWGGALVTGAGSQVEVDYVRAWRPTH